MTNYTGQKLALDSGQGRKAIQVLTQGLTERVRTMSSSRPFALFVVVCAVILGVYYFLMAAPIYVSEASFSIRGRETPTSTSALLSQLGGGVVAPAAAQLGEQGGGRCRRFSAANREAGLRNVDGRRHQEVIDAQDHRAHDNEQRERPARRHGADAFGQPLGEDLDRLAPLAGVEGELLARVIGHELALSG